ncbi:ATP-binding response regulator [Leptospira licerasiae]|uniref:Response regulator receiver domain protein n=1 Tax=Leptospira licerasiae str. MMD4847 TaxID=1049971 RepID=A0ABP2RCR2_9LEPT|nr:ATP-binding protein [Leptospira licerasiae]EIE03430.1 response regulator receiver domain / GHKL domain multi-domain protein [Leptospira licerasiae serovar Varillal str. VAR 010]EJZ42235.1 response regulator receiver domain protein [Leptospira licerasiae str. MMD4847]TGM86856.1 response regulator [Leptospira licerasiae]
MKILFVDDEEVIRDLFQEIFGSEYELVLAGTAEQGLSLAESETFDLIITDIRLPRMNGIEFITKLREKGVDTPFIVITGNQDIQISINALRLGAVDFFLKPFRMEAIRYSLLRFKNLFYAGKDLVDKRMFQVRESRQKFALLPRLGNLNQYVHLILKSLSHLPNLQNEDQLSLKVALYELIGNAIEHGCARITYHQKQELMFQENDYFSYVDKICESKEEWIQVEVDYDDTRVTVILEDGGDGFDPARVPDPVQDPNASQLSGRGIFLVRMNVDSLSYNDKGNQVTFVKKLQKAKAKQT